MLTLQVKKLPAKKNDTNSHGKCNKKFLCHNRTDIIEAKIVRILKSEKEMNSDSLFAEVKNKLNNIFTVERELYDTCINKLNEKEYLYLDSSKIKYIP